jgi:uncharacterized LabA/DUF88 family protein
MTTEGQRPKQVCVFIDINMLALLSHSPINYQRLKDWLVGQREGVVFRAYCGETRNNDRKPFYDYLRRLNIEPCVTKNPHSHSESAKDDDDIRRAICSEIAWDMRDLLAGGYYDTFVLVSGAFELSTVVSKVRQRGIEVEVVFDESCSPPLRSRATAFRPIHIEKFTQVEAGSERRSTGCFRHHKQALVSGVAS